MNDLEGKKQLGKLDADSTSRECPALFTLDVRTDIVVEDIIDGHEPSI